MKAILFTSFFFLLVGMAAVSRADSDISLGVASDYHAVRTTESALTAVFKLKSGAMAQAYFVAYQSDPTLFGLAGTYKKTVVGDNDDGFHLGGGVGIGKSGKDANFTHLNGIAGFHFPVGKRVTAHVDGGLTLGTADSKSQTLIGGNSMLFGMSLVYGL